MLNVNEIYSAICGESRFNGRPCVLVRLTGCHLRCKWCDSAHAFAEGSQLSIDQLVEQVAGHGLPTVLVTGGEPLLQVEVPELLNCLLDKGKTVLLETSGTIVSQPSISLSEVPDQVHRIVDIKAPGSGIDPSLIDWPGIAELGKRDEIKIVCSDRQDYDWARGIVLGREKIPAGIRVAFSPVAGLLEASLLAEWILNDCLDVVMQVQLHRVLWPDRDRGV